MYVEYGPDLSHNLSFLVLVKPYQYKNVQKDLFITFGVIIITDKQTSASEAVTFRWR